MNEFFAEVPNTQGRYWASTAGYVYDMKLKKVVPTRKTKRGWYDCKVWFGDKRTTINVHRVIAMTFFEPSELTVNHIDGDKSNNSIWNLEYMTREEQNLHRSRELYAGNQVPIYCEETGDIYPNSQVACEVLRIPNNGHISKNINGRYGHKSVYGYHFRRVS